MIVQCGRHLKTEELEQIRETVKTFQQRRFWVVCYFQEQPEHCDQGINGSVGAPMSV